MRPLVLKLGLTLLLLAGGCATVPRDPVARAEYQANHDPLEPLNRKIFAFNLGVDRYLLKPLAKGYRAAIPEGGRDALRSFINNLGEPVIFGNDLLQGRWHSAGITAARFVTNSTLGLAGLRDWARTKNLPRQTGDFGQTLDRWGAKEGAYLILPLVGPSNPRDLIGSGVDVYINPFRYVDRDDHYPTYLSTGREVVGGIDERSRNIESLDALQREAVDFYASFRSLFRQNRAAQLHQGQSVAPPVDIYADPEAAPPANPPMGK